MATPATRWNRSLVNVQSALGGQRRPSPALSPSFKIIWIIIRARQNFPQVPRGRLEVPRIDKRHKAVSLARGLLNYRIFWSKYGDGDENVPFLHRSATSSFLLKMTK
jgi:hypothetical protein